MYHEDVSSEFDHRYPIISISENLQCACGRWDDRIWMKAQGKCSICYNAQEVAVSPRPKGDRNGTLQES